MGLDSAVLTVEVADPAGRSRYILHVVPGNGGGVDRYVRDICAYRLSDCILHVAEAQSVFEKVADRQFFPIDRSQLTETNLKQAFGQPSLVHVHSTVAPVRELVTDLCKALGVSYVLTLHDIDFAGMADSIDHQERQLRLAFVRNAMARIVPSRFIASILSTASHGEISAKLIENGVDRDNCSSTSYVDRTADPGQFDVVVVGALGFHKGLDFLREVVLALPLDIRIAVIGYCDGQLLPGWLIEDRLWVHGAFETAELIGLVRSYGARLAFFPNRQPESYSYALSDIWCAGLPALGPSNGAIGERILQTGAGWTFDPESSAHAVAAMITSCLGTTDVPLGKVSAAVRQLLSRQEMVTRLNSLYDSVSAANGIVPDLPALQALAATQLNGQMFRAELRRLAGDIAFARRQVASVTESLESLSKEYEGRGAWIAKLEQSIADLKSQCDRLQKELDAESLSLKSLAKEYDGRGTWIAKLEQNIEDLKAECVRLESARQAEHEAHLAARTVDRDAYFAARLAERAADRDAYREELAVQREAHQAARAMERDADLAARTSEHAAHLAARAKERDADRTAFIEAQAVERAAYQAAQASELIAHLDARAKERDTFLAALAVESNARATAEAARAAGHEEFVRVSTKLERDVTDTLAIAHRYERALAMLPFIFRRWLLKRADRHVESGELR